MLRAIYGVPFGTADPVFSRDIGFYVFTLPALSTGLGFLLTLTTLSLLLVVPVYVLRGDVVPAPRGLRIEPSAGLHIAILLALFFVLLALELWLVDIPELLYSTTGPLIGASYTDLHARLPAMHLSAAVALVAAVAVLIGAVRGRLAQYGLLAVGAYAVVGAVGRGLFPLAMQNFIVAPTELTRETPYLRNHIIATRQAWGLDSVEVRELRGGAGLTMAEHPGQRADHRERAALGPRPAAPDLRPAPGDPHLLRFRLGGRRPLLDRRQVPAGAALAA